MNKNELIDGIYKNSSLTKRESREALSVIANIIKDSLSKGDEVKITGFGKFSVKLRDEKVAINPQTKEKIVLPAKRVASFKVGKELKEAVSG